MDEPGGSTECDGREKEEMLKRDLERNVTLCLHNSFCRNRESNVDPYLVVNKG